jgi:hypothetical protein
MIPAMTGKGSIARAKAMTSASVQTGRCGLAARRRALMRHASSQKRAWGAFPISGSPQPPQIRGDDSGSGSPGSAEEVELEAPGRREPRVRGAAGRGARELPRRFLSCRARRRSTTVPALVAIAL